MARPALRFHPATARCRERIRVLDRALRLVRVIAAVKRRKPQLFQSPEDPTHARDCRPSVLTPANPR